MAIAPLHHPADLHYLMEHQVWARLHGDGTATVGITELGIRLSGEIYMCRAKPLTTAIAKGGTPAVGELAKALIAGTVVALNGGLDERPELVHRDPYGEGWIARLRLADFGADQPALLHGNAVAPAMARHAWDHRTELVPATSGGAPS